MEGKFREGANSATVTGVSVEAAFEASVRSTMFEGQLNRPAEVQCEFLGPISGLNFSR